MTRDLVSWVLRSAISVAAAGLVAFVAVRIGTYVARRRPGLRRLGERLRTLVPLLAMLLALRSNFDAVPGDHRAWTVGAQLTTIATICVAVWIASRSFSVLETMVVGRFDINEPDNLRARSIRTQVQVLRRVITVVLVAIGVVAALLTFPWGRQLGTSILAAGGIIGVIIGVAGKPTLSNIVAGVEIAVTGPIRIDDVVVVEDEWGRVEEIGLTNVVVRLWDERRLVLPTAYFVEKPFQNWTRRQADLIGSVELWVDHSAPIDDMRAELERLVRRSERWDGRVAVLQVTDSSEYALQVRALVSAADASRGWDLRCEVREGLAQWLVTHSPSSLPRFAPPVERAEATAR